MGKTIFCAFIELFRSVYVVVTWPINVSTLSEVLRRSSCVLAESSGRSSSDRAVWRKPMVFTADAIMLCGLNRLSPATD
jgi:hypothetical protein